ncbi:polysaccharide deacetylase family protein [Anabaena sp. FACHB-1237]|uniref:polysaccharide deacetylase family protein n=1 Tax=Anabaena sp. FACHB-1237 TaxID=2692769 RepID=UPI001680C5D4|nr:polysaccharide deacetylase family protein [Anabaena sp. FACHB-1237]
MYQNYNYINHKSIKIFLLSITLLSLTSCTNIPNTSQLKTNNESLKVAIPENKITPKTQPPTKVENLNFTVTPKFAGKTVYKIEPTNKEKVIALTIDDGPWPKTTTEMLDILKQNDVKATFFWVGSALQENPEIAKEVVAEGHAIGNHTWHHWYKKMDAATAKNEIEKTNQLIYKTTGVKTSFFRPPGGYLNNGLAAYAKSQQNSVIMWSVTSADTDRRAKYQVFVKNVLRDAKPGAIVLMHDGGGNRERTVKALPEIISGLKKQGYQFVTIPELLAMEK